MSVRRRGAGRGHGGDGDGVVLRGVTWDHERAYPPLLRAAAEHRARTGVRIAWEVRSLHDFGVASLAEVARDHDVVVIDHPHVGEAAALGYLEPLDRHLSPEAWGAVAGQAVGRSHESYTYAGSQWALALDAATQVSAWRPDRLATPPATWDEVRSLARDGAVLWPLGFTDGFMSFLSLAAHRELPAGVETDRLVDAAAGTALLEELRDFAVLLDPACLSMSPIVALERLSAAGGRASYVPLTFGYTNYARAGFREHLLRFGDVPTDTAGAAPRGAILGGAGLAVSASSASVGEAARFAAWACGPEAQAGCYLAAGGQPAHRAAWDAPEADRLVGGFFTGTRRTMDGAWTRPRSAAWLPTQAAGMRLVLETLSSRLAPAEAIAQLNAVWAAANDAERAGR